MRREMIPLDVFANPRLILFFTLFVCMAVFTSCGHSKKVYTPGTYLGTSEGYYEETQVEVTVDDYQIIDLHILQLDETPIITEAVLTQLPQRIIKNNRTDIDVISGATHTSKSLFEAVDNALELARKVE